MPGKKDPEYFPLNLNTMSGMGSFYGDESPLTGSPQLHHGKFEYGSGMSPPHMSFNVSIPPVNSEEDETDDESSSVTGSDIDVDMDTLVYRIREKLKMSPKFSANIHHHNYWAESGMNDDGPDGCEDDDEDEEEEDVVVSGANNSANSGSNNSNHTNNSSSNNISNSSISNNSSSNNSRRFRNHQSYSQWRHSIHHQNSHHHNNHHHNYHHRQILNGGISKQHHKSSCHHHWWTSSKSLSEISRVNGGSRKGAGPGGDDPYSLLQELIESGSLIKEAVRRINLKTQKRFNSLNNSGSGGGGVGPGVVVPAALTKKFSYRDTEDTENSYPPLPVSAP